MNSLRPVPNDYKQTDFDHVPEDVNEQTLQLERGIQKIRIIDKPIPLDISLDKAKVNDDLESFDMNKRLRYQKLKETRDRLFAKKQTLKPTPVIESPKKKDPFEVKLENVDSGNNNVTSTQQYEPLSTKIFPSSQQREERIRVLKKMIYKAERESQRRLGNEKEADLGPIQPRIEPLKNVSLSPPASGKRNSPTIDQEIELEESVESSKSSEAKRVKKDIPSDKSMENQVVDNQSSLLESAIEEFENLNLQRLKQELSREEKKEKIVEAKQETDEGINVKDETTDESHLLPDNIFKALTESEELAEFNHEHLFKDLDNRLAILEYQIDKLNSEITNLEAHESSFTNLVNLKTLRNCILLSVFGFCFFIISYLVAD